MLGSMMDKVLNFAFARETLSQYYCSESWMVAGVVVGLRAAVFVWPSAVLAVVAHAAALDHACTALGTFGGPLIRTNRVSQRRLRVVVSFSRAHISGFLRRDCARC